MLRSLAIIALALPPVHTYIYPGIGAMCPRFTTQNAKYHALVHSKRIRMAADDNDVDTSSSQSPSPSPSPLPPSTPTRNISNPSSGDMMRAMGTSPRRIIISSISSTFIALGANFFGLTSNLLSILPQSFSEQTGIDRFYPRGDFKRYRSGTYGYDILIPKEWVADQALELAKVQRRTGQVELGMMDGRKEERLKSVGGGRGGGRGILPDAGELSYFCFNVFLFAGGKDVLLFHLKRKFKTLTSSSQSMRNILYSIYYHAFNHFMYETLHTHKSPQCR